MYKIKHPVLQTQAAECGLACLAMICAAFGRATDLQELRHKYQVSSKGLGLSRLIQIATEQGLAARPVRVELEQLSEIRTPSILHWNMSHFVVLEPSQPGLLGFSRSQPNGEIVIIDPARGRVTMSLAEASRHFTGVAVSFIPTEKFEQRKESQHRARIGDVLGSVHGLRSALVHILLISLVLEAMAVVAPLFSQLAIDEAATGNDVQTITVIAMSFIAILMMQTATSAARSWLLVRLSQSLSFQWASNVFSHLLNLPISYFERRHTGDIANRFRSVNEIRNILTSRAVESVIDGLLAVVSLAIMFAYSVPLASISLLAILLYSTLRLLTYQPFRDLSSKALVASANENTLFIETLRAILQIRLFGGTETRRAMWQNRFVEIQNLDVQRSKLDILFSSANAFLMGLENVLVIWVASLMLADPTNKTFTVGMLIAYMGFKYQFGLRFSSLIDYVFQLRMLGLHVERLADITRTEPEAGRRANVSLIEPGAPAAPKSIELRNVRFRYGDAEPWILDGVNMHVGKGEHVALTGPSGAGKSTLIKILLGVLEPTEGTVLFGGVDIRCLDLHDLRAEIGAVLQDDILLTGTIAQNVSFFGAEVDQEWVERCATLAQVHQEIERMPMKYYSLIGDLGSGLSGGQRQRILLARALYKRPGILILDEATSHLDSANEKAVGAAISEIPLTRFVIAHREETIRCADRVIFLANGKIHGAIAASNVEEPDQVVQ